MGTDYQASVMIIRCTVLFRATGSGVWLRCEDVCVKKLGLELRKPLFSFIHVAVPGRKRILFRHVFRSHPRIQSNVSLNFH